MSIGRIEAQWLSYRHLVVPKDASDIQVRECRRAFYAGAESLLGSVLAMLAPGEDTEPTEEDLKRMDDVQQELVSFAMAVKEGKA